MLETHIGEFVYVSAGRDKGKCFIVLSCDGTYAYLCDGKRRKVSTPKKKSVKHISFTGRCDSFILEKLTKKAELTNKEAKRAVTNFSGDVKISEI